VRPVFFSAAAAISLDVDCITLSPVMSQLLSGSTKVQLLMSANERSIDAFWRVASTAGSGGSMAKAQRTTHRSSTNKKLYAVRDASGRFKDIQTYERAHRADMAKTSKAEKTAAVKTAARKTAKKR